MYTVLGASGDAGTKTALVPAALTVPASGRPPSADSPNEAAFTLVGSSALLSSALTAASSATPVAPSGGEVDRTAGATPTVMRTAALALPPELVAVTV